MNQLIILVLIIVGLQESLNAQLILKYCDGKQQNECILTNQCAFYDNKCQLFLGCESYNQEQSLCQQINHQCIKDLLTEYCQDKRLCNQLNYYECGMIDHINGDKSTCKLSYDSNYNATCQEMQCEQLTNDNCFKLTNCYSTIGTCKKGGYNCEEYKSDNCDIIKPKFGKCKNQKESLNCISVPCSDYPIQKGNSEIYQYQCQQYQDNNGNKCVYRSGDYCQSGERLQVQQVLKFEHTGKISYNCYDEKSQSECENTNQCAFPNFQMKSPLHCSISKCVYDGYDCYSEQCANDEAFDCKIVTQKLQSRNCVDVKRDKLCIDVVQPNGHTCYSSNINNFYSCYEAEYCEMSFHSCDNYGNYCFQYERKCLEFDKPCVNYKSQQLCEYTQLVIAKFICYWNQDKCMEIPKKECSLITNESDCISDYEQKPCIWLHEKCQLYQHQKCASITSPSKERCSQIFPNCLYNQESCVPLSDFIKVRVKGSSFSYCNAMNPLSASDGNYCTPLRPCELYPVFSCISSYDKNQHQCKLISTQNGVQYCVTDCSYLTIEECLNKKDICYFYSACQFRKESCEQYQTSQECTSTIFGSSCQFIGNKCVEEKQILIYSKCQQQYSYSYCLAQYGCAWINQKCQEFAGCESYVETPSQLCQQFSSRCVSDPFSSFCAYKQSCSSLSQQYCGQIENESGVKYACVWGQSNCYALNCESLTNENACSGNPNCIYEIMDLGGDQYQFKKCSPKGKACEEYSSQQCSTILTEYGRCKQGVAYNKYQCQQSECQDYVDQYQCNNSKNGSNKLDCKWSNGQCQIYECRKDKCNLDICFQYSGSCLKKEQCNQYVKELCLYVEIMELQHCIWTSDRCVDFSCQYSSTCSEQQCFNNGYSCQEIENKLCENIKKKEYCISDKDNHKCIWNQKVQQCLSVNQCSDIKDLDICLEYSNLCIVNSGKCIAKSDCQKMAIKGDSFKYCNGIHSNCATNGIDCIPLSKCEHYPSNEQCLYSINNEGKQCYLQKDEFGVWTCSQEQLKCQDIYAINYNECFQQNKSCYYDTKVGQCVDKFEECEYHTTPDSCISQYDGYKCIFDRINNECRELICSDLITNSQQCDSQLLCEFNHEQVCSVNGCLLNQSQDCVQKIDCNNCQEEHCCFGECYWQNQTCYHILSNRVDIFSLSDVFGEILCLTFVYYYNII